MWFEYKDRLSSSENASEQNNEKISNRKRKPTRVVDYDFTADKDLNDKVDLETFCLRKYVSVRIQLENIFDTTSKLFIKIMLILGL
jgi:hypothetical protein